MKRKLTCVDLFCGAGGLSRGFLDAGYDVVLGVDFDDAALKTFQQNHGDTHAMKLDLYSDDSIEQIIRYLEDAGIQSVDVLVGGPPCQGFSYAGKMEADDRRNFLYLAMVKLTRRLKPKAVLIENVLALAEANGGAGAQRIIDDFTAIGYHMKREVLFAPDYGVPQVRKRVFFVGLYHSGQDFIFPPPVLDAADYVTAEDAVSDLPSLQDESGNILRGDEEQAYMTEPASAYQRAMRKDMSVVYNHIGCIPIEKTRKMISLVPEGKNYLSLPDEYRGMYKYHEALTRYHSKKPSLTINTGHRSHFHYKWNRIPTVRESARLQSFPDDFIFYGNQSQQFKQVGNAVPPLLGKALAEQLKPYLVSTRYRMIDLFAGCGGLEDGFLQSGRYEDIAAVEWLQPQVKTLTNRLKTKWNISDADQRVMCFDIQREQELFHGWSDSSTVPSPELLPGGKESRYKTGPYGKGRGLDYFVNKAGGIDIIIGGPPCQAYSIAGRVRDENGMRDDYRNYLFEHYLSVVKRYKPKVFVFENVPGLLSAMPDGTPIAALIRRGFHRVGYEIVDDIKRDAKINASDYGVAQHRERLIILGIRKDVCGSPQTLLQRFYRDILPKYKVSKKRTVEEAIGDLPAIYPITGEKASPQRISYTRPDCKTTWHRARRHSLRDVEIYGMLAEDISSGRNEYADSAALSELYEKRVGARSPIHRYHVLRRGEPGTTIISHLDRDGNRFIHYDPRQSRDITPREAARLQSFDDDFDFIGTQTDVYIMIGNAVPPLLAKCVALAAAELLDELTENQTENQNDQHDAQAD